MSSFKPNGHGPNGSRLRTSLWSFHPALFPPDLSRSGKPSFARFNLLLPVQELHRLYEVQKKLMSDVRSKTLKKKISFLAASNPHVITGSKNKIRNIKSTSETSHCSHATVLNHSTDVPNSEYTSTLPFSTDESSRELNYCLGEPLKRSREYNFQQPAEGDSHDSCSGLDLTLSIGCATDMNTKTDWKRMPNDSSLLLSPDLNMPDRIQEYTNSAAGFSLESLQRPYWLFQALSLNKT